jgi:hypothetical protein
MPRLLVSTILAAAALAAPASASAADTLIAADPVAQQVTALDGAVVWVSGKFGHQKLMQRTPDGTVAAVKGTRESRSYSSIDLGHNSDGSLLLTYLRCDAGGPCKALWNDLDGRRATFRKLALPGCEVSTAPAQWRTRIAYGLYCGGSAATRKQTGLYVKTGSRPPVRLPRPKDAVKFHVMDIESVDLRGTRVTAVAADIYEYAFSETTAGRDLESFLAAASEGESDGSVRGNVLATGNVQWTLTNSSHTGDPNETVITRSVPRGCTNRERLTSPDDAEFLAIDLAVDGTTPYLVVPGAGVVQHAFTPSEGVCAAD